MKQQKLRVLYVRQKEVCGQITLLHAWISIYFITYPFKRRPHKMVKHTQTICREFADEFFECDWPFYTVGAWRVYTLTYGVYKKVTHT